MLKIVVPTHYDLAIMAEAILGHPDGRNLEAIEEAYDLVDPVSVREFLSANDYLIDLLLDAKHEIDSRFGSDARLLLDVEADLEADDEERELVLLIETALDRRKARELRESLDKEWWLGALPAARHRLTIDLQYA